MKRSVMRLVVAVMAVALALSACGGGGGGTSGGSAGEGSKELTLGVLAEPSSWHPAQTHVGHLLQPYQLAYDSLLLRKPDGTLAPMLATEWKYTDEAKTELQMKLRTDVTFSNGDEFNAEAVKKNLDGFKAANGKQVAMLQNYAETVIDDPATVTIKLTQADPAFEYYMSQAAGLMGAPSALDGEEIVREPVGSGPYVMVANESVVGSQYVFTKREGYWNTDLQKWDKVTLRLMNDITARVNAVTTGEVDATLLDATTEAQAQSSGLEVLKWPVDWTGLLLMDRDGAIVPALADARVRQAINYAIDREALLKNVALGNGEITSQVFGPESGSFLKELDKYYTYDPEKAKSLLAEAGYADGFSFKVPMYPNSDVMYNYVAQYLGDVGIKVEMEAVPAADIQGTIGKGTFPVVWFNLFQGPTWVAINQLIVPKTLYNPFQSTTPEIAALIGKTRAAGEDVGKVGEGVNEYVTKQAWFAPFYRVKQVYVYDKAKVKVTPQVQMAVPPIYNYEPVG